MPEPKPGIVRAPCGCSSYAVQKWTPDIRGDPLVLHCPICKTITSDTKKALDARATTAYHERRRRRQADTDLDLGG